MRVATVPAARWRTDLTYVSEVLWQVESEFARNSREALFDFNKLVLGSAHHKLFVGPDLYEASGFLPLLLPAARACTGEVYAAFVPHPDRWGQRDIPICVSVLREGQWVALEIEKAPA